jgi:hypothetical protein
MVLPPGSRVSVRWSDGRTYSAMIVGFQQGWYSVRFDGTEHNQWAPAHSVDLDGSLPEPGMQAAAAHGVHVYDEGANVMAHRAGFGVERCMIIEYVAHRRQYNVMWDRDNAADHIDPAAIDASSHYGLYGHAAQEERNNPTVPRGSHVIARRRDGRMMGGTITKNAGEKFLCRWDGERAREWITKDAIVQLGGVAPPPPPRAGEIAMLGLQSDPRRPPTRDQRDWYRDGEPVWVQDDDDEWWYEAVVVSREWHTREGVAGGDNFYTIEWADGLGRERCFGSRMRPRSFW